MTRTTDRAVSPQFLARWSPRAFDGSAVDEGDLLTLFDAARWAPSAYNYQPWRFVWAQRDDAGWNDLLGLLLPFNAAWAREAGALVFVLSDRQILAPGASEPQEATTASFDAGAAWALLALQAETLGLATHAMAGFDHARAPEVLGAGDRFKVEAAIAIGRRGDKAQLPETLQAREVPSPRKDVHEFAFAARLPG
ncbi:nitroreductase family protein [Novosphingobium sp. KCTC 2891]|uniref:nitroreductase family protein n=1 Tax=Novosphingobium sp. KCTC 2891 TaxID=2989730 RepID=UPI002223CC11|nr:nitroreductase family protein [Novosphingobium sp. KCTC 2891]MCW1383566.1 nitroreductase family protein [Novosphingobium sp. KCTC 2891]